MSWKPLLRVVTLACLLACVLGSSGCVNYRRKIAIDTSKMTPVRFESAEAAKLFYTISEVGYAPYADMQITMAAVALINMDFTVHRTEYHNVLVSRADLDRNSVLTLEEVQSLQPPKKEAAASE